MGGQSRLPVRVCPKHKHLTLQGRHGPLQNCVHICTLIKYWKKRRRKKEGKLTNEVRKVSNFQFSRRYQRIRFRGLNPETLKELNVSNLAKQALNRAHDKHKDLKSHKERRRVIVPLCLYSRFCILSFVLRHCEDFSPNCNWDSSQSDSSMVLERAHSTIHALHTEGKCLRSLQ